MIVASLAIAAPAPPAPTPALMKLAKETYDVTCAACHGATGEGNGPVAFAVKPPPRSFVKDDFKAGDSVEQIYRTVTNGLPGTKMVGYPALDEEQRWGVAYYVRAFRPKR